MILILQYQSELLLLWQILTILQRTEQVVGLQCVVCRTEEVDGRGIQASASSQVLCLGLQFINGP